jgi:hypothetical protein
MADDLDEEALDNPVNFESKNSSGDIIPASREGNY